MENSPTRGETLQTDLTGQNLELQFYTRRNITQRDRNQTVELTQDQSDTPVNGPENSSMSLSPSSHSTLPNVSNLDIPIAQRKGTRQCTKYPIANYLSYHRLSDNHKAFTSKITNLFVPRNIQEALNDSNWKLAVMEEMNVSKQSVLWT